MYFAYLHIKPQTLVIPIPDHATPEQIEEAIKEDVWKVLSRINDEGKLFDIEIEYAPPV